MLTTTISMMETATRSAGKDLKESPDTCMMEETGNGTITRYIRGLGIISSDSEEAKTYYHYVSDEQGSITHVLSEDAEILNHYSYDAFGNIIEKTEKVENRFCYNGEMLDPITQQYYLRARFYNPVIGRFTQEDTYYGDGLNLYQYCQANPVGYVDPSGHTCEIVQNHYKQYQEYRKQHPEANAAEAYEAVTGKKGISSERHYDIKNGTKYEKITDYLKSKKQKYKGGGNNMNNNFPLNRFDFSNLVKDIYEMNVLPDVLTDTETGIEFYGVNSVSREFLICFLSEFNLIDNLAQKDSEQEYEKQERYDVKNYQFEPTWVEIAFDKVTVGYVGIYVNADFSLIFEKDNDEWNLIGK